MIASNTEFEKLSRDEKLEMPITTLFIGSFHRAIYILTKLDDEEEAIAKKCWRVKFDDPETKAGFVVLCPDALCVDGIWWLVDNICIREWLIEKGGILLEEIVSITFASLRLRAAFMAETDH